MKVKNLPTILKIAPGFLGAFFLALASSACKEKDQGGDWAGQAHAPAAPAKPAPAQAPAPAPSTTPAPATPEPVATTETVADGTQVRLVTYNVENWLTMDRYVNGKQVPGAPKPEAERHKVTEAILSVKPDILGISEIGNENDVKDLQKHLSDAGLDLPHFHLNRGSDDTRSLVILSRYPIGKTVVHENLSYQLSGKQYGMQRGILDATIGTPAGEFRFLGVHLKSKREVEEGDQEEMRRQEAHLLRREIDSILQTDPQARLVVYGDFNDTRNSPTVKTVHGSGKGPTSLNMIALKDSRGQYWTHHWDYQDTYTRIDYVLVSQALRRSVEWDLSKIIDTEAVDGASDHRPLLVILKK